jgi:hypothetical protein
MAKILNLISKCGSNLIGLINGDGSVITTQRHVFDNNIVTSDWKKVIAAPKIILPENGILFDDGLKGLPDWISLPFDCVAVEHRHVFVSEEKGITSIENTILLAEQTDQDIIISKFSEFRAESGDLHRHWFQHPYRVCIYRDGKKEESTNVRTMCGVPDQRIKVRTAFIHGNLWSGVSDAGQGLINSYASRSVRAILEMIEALSCSNVMLGDPGLVSTKLNKEKMSRRRLPFYQYKILEIHAPAKAHKKGIPTKTHASPRQHLRRGHVRIYNRGTENEFKIWVNSAVVGNASNGVIEKKYRISA